jgi:hypothetical protein
MANKQAKYLSYLLRLWRDNNDEKQGWRASLQSSLAGDQKSFADPEQLFRFLRRQTGMDFGSDDHEDGTESRQRVDRRRTPEP